jgi:hypothetical protein
MGEVWLVGFPVRQMGKIQLLSGLADVIDIRYDHNLQSVVFVVKNKDQSGVLFRSGTLKASSVPFWNEPQQALVVDRIAG